MPVTYYDVLDGVYQFLFVQWVAPAVAGVSAGAMSTNCQMLLDAVQVEPFAADDPVPVRVVHVAGAVVERVFARRLR